jgi:Tol biopolymer transport system component
MRRLTTISIVLFAAACQDGSPTSPTRAALPSPALSRGTPTPIIDCGQRCNRIAFVREGNPENGGYPTIFTIKPDGTGLTQVLWLADQPTWSPNHQKLAFKRKFSNPDGIGTINPDGTGLKILTSQADDQDPKFSPDGSKILFARRTTTGTMDLWIMNADGTQQMPITQTPLYSEYEGDFSPDGKKLVYVTSENSPFNMDIAVLDLATMTHTVISAGPTHELNPSWSPDGKRIAFQTNAFGPNVACIVMVNPDGTNRTEITANGSDCSQPSWSPDATSLAFRIKANGISLIATALIVNNVPASYALVTKQAYLDSEPAWAR